MQVSVMSACPLLAHVTSCERALSLVNKKQQSNARQLQIRTHVQSLTHH